jgi:hypothetical protein
MEQAEIFMQVALRAWNAQMDTADKFFTGLSDESMMKEVAPGKNRVIYLLGHLIAVHDRMIELLGASARLYPNLDEAFINSPDKSGHDMPSVSELREDWKKSKDAVAAALAKFAPADWFGRHMSMTDEDLVKDPARNRLSVLLSRTTHLAYHLGQVKLVS